MEIFGVKSDGYLKNVSGQKLRPIGGFYEYKSFSTLKHDVSINYTVQKSQAPLKFLPLIYAVVHDFETYCL